MYKKPSKGWTKHLDFIIIDLLCLQFAFVLAFWYRFGNGQNPYTQNMHARTIILMMTVLDILVAVLFGSYSSILKRSWFRQIIASARHSFIVLAAVTVYLFATKSGDTYSRILVILTAVLHFIITYFADILYKSIRWGKNNNSQSMFVISTSTEVDAAIRNIQSDKQGIIIKGLAILDQHMTGELIQGIPVVANRDTIDYFILRDWVDEVYVRLPQDDEINEVVFSSLREMGVTIHIDATAYQSLSGCDFVMEQIGESLVITTSMKMMPAWQLTIKRAVDIIGGIVGTVFMLIFSVCIAPFVLSKSPGPLIFTQERIGRNGRRFKMYKFRSMYMDAEARKAALVKATGQEDRMMFKLDDDPRIIGSERKDKAGRPKGIGNFIRNTSIDEFPQFWNVLKGDMSLVGTRPPTVDEWERYDLRHRARMSTKPGITGLWQVSGRSDIVDFEEVVRLDTKYIMEWSLKLDFQILCKTVAVVLRHKGAK